MVNMSRTTVANIFRRVHRALRRQVSKQLGASVRGEKGIGYAVRKWRIPARSDTSEKTNKAGVVGATPGGMVYSAQPAGVV